MTHESSETTRQVQAMFDRLAPDYDGSGISFFQPIADRLVEILDPKPAERVLDIGCGRGAATVRLAERVLPDGSVTAVDLSPAMVEEARAALTQAGFDGEFHVMDAATPDLAPAAYDVVASSLVLFFVDDPGESLTRWVRLLRPGGRIGLATFRGEEDPTWAALDALFRPWLPPRMRDPKISTTQSPFATDGGLESMLRDAGAHGVRTHHLDLPVTFDGVEDWRRWSMSTGQRAMWAGIPDEEVPGVLAAADRLLSEASGADGRTVLTSYVRYTTGRRPAP